MQVRDQAKYGRHVKVQVAQSLLVKEQTASLHRKQVHDR